MLYLQRPCLLDIVAFDLRLLAELLGLSVRADINTQIPPREREHDGAKPPLTARSTDMCT